MRCIFAGQAFQPDAERPLVRLESLTYEQNNPADDIGRVANHNWMTMSPNYRTLVIPGTAMA